MAKLLALQMTSSSDPVHNIRAITRILTANQHLVEPNNSLVVIPECAPVFGCSGREMLRQAEILGEGSIQREFAEIAKSFKVFLVAGSMPTLPKAGSQKYYATSLLISPEGTTLASYNKIHLFDVEVADKTKSYRESKYTLSGKQVVKHSLGWSIIGLTICYDLRFSGLFKALQPAQIICVPSAFTKVTGEAHWHALLQARAIENQCYIVAANQFGVHEDGRETFGNSCIYSPWGELLGCVKSGEGVAVSEFRTEIIERIRRQMPVFEHSLDKYE